MIDPRRVLVLIRKDENSSWWDRTDDIESIKEESSQIIISFTSNRGKPSKPFRYDSSRVAVCTRQRVVPIPPEYHLSVCGTVWPGSNLEIVEFDTPDGKKRRIFRTYQSGRQKHYTYPAEKVKVLPNTPVSPPQEHPVLQYFREIIKTKDPEKDPIVRAYKALDGVDPESAVGQVYGGHARRSARCACATNLSF